MPFCPKCGAQVGDSDRFCNSCGSPITRSQPSSNSNSSVTRSSAVSLVCPKCGSTNIRSETFQEQDQSVTTGVSKTKLVEKRHGFFWWLLIGWWWMIIKAVLWIVAFIPMALIRAGRRKKYVGTTTTVNTTKNRIQYRIVCTCQDCGHIWKKQ